MADTSTDQARKKKLDLLSAEPRATLKADLHGTILAYDCRMRFL